MSANVITCCCKVNTCCCSVNICISAALLAILSLTTRLSTLPINNWFAFHTAVQGDSKLHIEQIAQLPHSYQPNDRQRALPPATPRSRLGLAEPGLTH